MASRNLADLAFGFRGKAAAFQDECASLGFDVLIYCTYRSLEEQARLYRNGRALRAIQRKRDELIERGREDLASILMEVGPQSGSKLLTNAAPGESYHNYGLAFDAVPLRQGRPSWGSIHDEEMRLWHQYGDLVESCHMEWAGKWRSFREYPHAQESGLSIKSLLTLPNYVLPKTD